MKNDHQRQNPDLQFGSPVCHEHRLSSGFCNTSLNSLAMILLAAFASISFAPDQLIGQDPNTQQNSESSDQVTADQQGGTTESVKRLVKAQEDEFDPERPIRFTYNNMPWKTVIDDLAKDAGMTVQYFDEPPSTTFTYKAIRDYSVSEAIDFLNQHLSLRGFTLIRTQQMLTFIDREKGIPEDLIEHVPLDELDQRGRFELLKTTFDTRGLSESFVDEIRGIVDDTHDDHIVFVPSSNQLIVREVGQQLRLIRGLVEQAKSNRGLEGFEVEEIRLKHIEVEDAVNLARPILDIAPNANQSADGNLKFSIDVVGSRVIATGEQQLVARFRRTLEKFDSKTGGEDEIREPASFKTHRVRGDIKKAYQVLQTMMAGRPDIRLDFDEKQGTIMALGRSDDHEMVKELISELQSQSDGFAILEPKELTPTELVDSLTEFFPSSEVEGVVSGPVFQADKYRNRVVVKATPQEIGLIQRMVAELDQPSSDLDESTGSRLIPLDEFEIGTGLDAVQELWSTLDRSNPIEIRTNDDRVIRYNKRRGMFVEYGVPEKEDSINSQFKRPQSSPGNVNPSDNQRQPSIRESIERRRERPLEKKDDPARADGQSQSSFRVAPSSELVAVLAGFPSDSRLIVQEPGQTKKQDKEGNGHGKSSSSDESKADMKNNQSLQDGQPSDPSPIDDPSTADDEVQEKKSIPGAPVRVRVTKFGIVIESDDHEAAYELENLILDALQDSSSLLARPGAFRVNNRDVLEVESQLKQMIGLSDGGSGGGGGLGGLLGGAMSNAVGGAAGDVVGGLLGGGGLGGSSGGGAIYAPEGEVSIVADVKLQTLFVSATPTDMQNIELIIEELDREEGPHGPNILGESYLIFIEYRDPNEIADIIRQNYKAYLNDSQQAGGGGENAAAQMQAQVQQQMLRALTGRGGRGGGGDSDPEAAKPKASLSVDENRSALVVTGPYSIYEDINALAKMLDQPGPDAFHTSDFVKLEVAAPTIESSLRSAFGNKIVFESVAEDEAAGSASINNRSQNNRNTQTTNNDAARQAIQRMNQFRQMMQQQQRGNQRGGAGGRGGRGGGTGGGRGGRGGGGFQRGGGRGG